jgi:2-polyprenyl-3-methyl-5-hydroxy-6-metoxy-1,4-benzoquinol methylase
MSHGAHGNGFETAAVIRVREEGCSMGTFSNSDVIHAWSAADPEPESFDDEGDFARRELLNPAILEILGEPRGKRILDAGCGQGYLCRLLARRGANVTGVEPAEGFYRYAVAREGGERLGITYIQEDLAAFARQGEFDCVIANMVLMDIPDYEPAMRNCIAALKPGGDFIFSLSHPCFEASSSEWARKGCVEVREYLHDYAIAQTISSRFHRPLSSYLNLILRAGCVLRHMVEPQLSVDVARQLGNDRDVHVPSFIILHATKSDA